MRQGLKDAISGWILVKDVEVLGEYIEAAAAWVKENGPLEPDEERTIQYMIECQLSWAIERGDFEPYIGHDLDSGDNKGEADAEEAGAAAVRSGDPG